MWTLARDSTEQLMNKIILPFRYIREFYELLPSLMLVTLILQF